VTTSLRDTLQHSLAGRYAIERELGRGGMATVYLARDLRHQRLVALKVLDPELGAVLGAERFLSEIRVTANLQHPNLLPLFDSGEANGLLYYVMPFVDGESLRARLERERQLPVEEAVRIAVAVAGALAYAHERGIIHRDLKPENILLQAGQPVVADFGIALAVSNAGGQRVTQTGLSLGTPQYMSPEQATGDRQIDARTDIYSLAAVAYEMLAGEPPHLGSTAQAIIAKLMTEEPRPLTVLRRAVPPHVDAAVRHALEKLPADRFADARAFAAALTTATTHPAQPERIDDVWRRRALATAALAGVLALAVAGTTAAWLRGGRDTALPVLTARLAAPREAPSELRHIALSPDGSHLAFVSATAADGGRIWLRRLSDGAARALDGTQGATHPFWAPDGSAIAFFSAGWLRVVSLGSGGRVRPLAAAPNPAGGAWAPDGTILYSPFFGRLMRVSAAGGTPANATSRDPGRLSDREPSFLPDGHRFLFWRSGDGTATMWLGDLRTGETRELARNVSSPRYVAPGYLLFFQAGQQAVLGAPAPLMAQRFDASRLELEGEPVELARVERPDQVAVYAATPELVLAREPLAGTDAESRLFWLDRATGQRTPILGAGPTWTFRIAPDGRRVAFGGDGLWVYDPARDVAVRVPTSAPFPTAQLWSPDGTRIAVVKGPAVAVVTVDGNAPEREIPLSDDAWIDPKDWTVDGWIYYLWEPDPDRPHWQLWRANLESERRERAPTGPGNIVDARVSPDGRWIAWESDASGRHEIYLGPVAGTTAPARVSKAGGGSPQWRRDGRELFFLGGDGRMMVVSVELGPPPTIGEPRAISDSVVQPSPFLDQPRQPTRFGVSPDGRRVLVQLPPDLLLRQLTLMQGWQARVGAARR
jgi:serine/threonine-protein kinase